MAINKLNPEVKSIRIEENSRYDKSRVTVTLEVTNGNREPSELSVKYPIQGGRHLMMLMDGSDKDGEPVSISQPDKLTIASAIRNAIDKQQKE